MMAEQQPAAAGGVEPGDRFEIAIRVLKWSSIGILVLSLAVIIGAAVTGERETFMQSTAKVFNAVLPLLGTWVGTVIAYYFSKANFQTANEAMRKTYRDLVEERLRKVTVKEAMIPYGPGMVRVELDETQPDNGERISLKSEFLDRLGGGVTRIPVFNKQRQGRFIIHESLLYKFVADIALHPPTPPIDAAGATLKDFLDHDGGRMRRIVSRSITYVGADATLADAKAAMESQAAREREAGCQDVFVTETGAAAEPVLGWLTNIEIGKRARA